MLGRYTGPFTAISDPVAATSISPQRRSHSSNINPRDIPQFLSRRSHFYAQAREVPSGGVEGGDHALACAGPREIDSPLGMADIVEEPAHLIMGDERDDRRTHSERNHLGVAAHAGYQIHAFIEGEDIG